MKKFGKLLLSAMFAFAASSAAVFSSVFADTAREVNAAGRAREYNDVDSGNALSMKVASGVLSWDSVDGASSYRVSVLSSSGAELSYWNTTLTAFSIVSQMDSGKFDTGTYALKVTPNGAGSPASMSYFYASDVDKLAAPTNLLWIGNKACWNAVEGASSYHVILYGFSGKVAEANLNDCLYDFSAYSPQNGWFFLVRALSGGSLSDDRNSVYEESPHRGGGERVEQTVESENALAMTLNVGVLSWNALAGASSYYVRLLDASGYVLATYSTGNTYYSLFPEMDNAKYESREYRVQVLNNSYTESATMSFYYMSNVEKLPSPTNVQWIGANACWEAVDGAASYEFRVYSYTGLLVSESLDSSTCLYDCSAYELKDGYSFTVRALSAGNLSSKRSSNLAESAGLVTPKAIYEVVVCGYDLTHTTNGGGVVTITSDQGVVGPENWPHSSATEGTKVTVTAAAATGFEFYGWAPMAPAKSLVVSTDLTYEFTVTGETYIYAIFEVETPLAFLTEPESSYVLSPGEYQNVTWSTNKTPDQFQISYWDGEAWDQWDIQDANDGVNDYDIGWDQAETIRFRIDAIVGGEIKASSSEFTIAWQANEYLVYYGPGEGEGSGEIDYVSAGTEITMADINEFSFFAPDGMVFDYWKIADDAYYPGDKYTVNADTYITAIWKTDPVVSSEVSSESSSEASSSESTEESSSAEESSSEESSVKSSSEEASSESSSSEDVSSESSSEEASSGSEASSEEAGSETPSSEENSGTSSAESTSEATSEPSSTGSSEASLQSSSESGGGNNGSTIAVVVAASVGGTAVLGVGIFFLLKKLGIILKK